MATAKPPHSRLEELRWGTDDGDPFVRAEFSDRIECWFVPDFGRANHWRKYKGPTHDHDRIIGKARFDKMYPNLPPLPDHLRSTSSHSGGNRERASS